MNYSISRDIQLIDHMVVTNMIVALAHWKEASVKVHYKGKIFDRAEDIINKIEWPALTKDVSPEEGWPTSWSGVYLELGDEIWVSSLHCLIPEELDKVSANIAYGSVALDYLDKLVKIMDSGEVIKVSGFGREASAEGGNGYWLALQNEFDVS